jgi:hypothetical protein
MGEMKQGLAIMKAPIELTAKNGKFRLELKNNNEILRYLQWDYDHISGEEVEALKAFIEIVYRQGFSDGSVAGMNK